MKWCKRSDEGIFKILFLSSSARDFVVSLFGIFFPIFLLTKGFSLTYILCVFLIYYLVASFAVYPLMVIISKFGIRKTFIFSCISAIPFYLFLYFSDFLIGRLEPFLFVIILFAFNKLYSTPYWYAYHLVFSECNNKKNLAKHLGEITSFSGILVLFSPFIGGLLINFFSFNFVFLLILIFLTLSLLPLFFIKYPKVPLNFDFKDLISFDFLKYNKVYFIEGVYGRINGFLWPIYLYIINLSFAILGLFMTLIKVVQSVTVYFLGYVLGKNSKKDNFLSKVGLFFTGIGVILRGIFSNLGGLFFAQSISSLGNPFFNMPILENMYERSEKNPVLSIVGRELFLNLGRMMAILIFLFFILIFGELNLQKIFIFIGLFLVLISIIKKVVFIYSS